MQLGSLEKPIMLPNFAKICTFNFRDWRASEASETLSGVTWKSEIYLYIYIYMVRETHFSSAVRGYVMWEELSVSHF